VGKGPPMTEKEREVHNRKDVRDKKGQVTTPLLSDITNARDRLKPVPVES